MPEEAHVSATIEIKKRHHKKRGNRNDAIKVSCGIGDSDGFPAFGTGFGEADEFSTPDTTTWGFRITGGSDFKMPITVFQVTKGRLASQGGLKLGDIIVEINDVDVTNVSLRAAQELIDNSEFKVHLIAINMGEDDGEFTGIQGEEKSIVLRKPKPLGPPKVIVAPSLIERRVWHPVMWEHPPVLVKEGEEEQPHHRIIRNIRRFFKEYEDKPEIRQKTLEDMLLALPR